MAALVLALGCGDNGGESESATDSASASGTSGTSPTTGPTEATGSASHSGTESAEGGVSESISGTTNDEGGVSESLSQSGGPDTETISGTGGTTDETGMISGGGDTSASTGSSTGDDPIVCTEIDNQQDCLDAGCAAISGQHFGGDEAMACLEATEFLACGDPVPCAEVITTVCDGEEKYQLPNACAPLGWVPCIPPPDQGMNGYPDCP